MAGGPGRAGDRRLTASSGSLRRHTVLLLGIAAAALFLRVYLPFHRVITEDYVNFQGDAWYHMRAVDHLVRNFPHRLTLDPYAAPGGQYVGVAPLFDYLVAGAAMVIGLGSPSARTVDIVGAAMPPVLAVATVLLVYAFGRRLFGGMAALLGALLAAIMPGPFLSRTLLGAADHHALEVTLSLATLLLLALAAQRASDAAWSTRRVVGVSCLAGLALGAYFLTWTSAAFLAFAVGVWMVVQVGLDSLRGRRTEYLLRAGGPAVLVAGVMVLALQNRTMYRYGIQVASLVALMSIVAFAGLADLVRFSSRRRALIVSAVSVLIGAALVRRFGVLDSGLSAAILLDLARFDPTSGDRAVRETQPLLSVSGAPAFSAAWLVFRSGFFVGVAALCGLAVRVRRRGSAPDTLLLTWGTIVLGATLAQIRFGYYLVPVLAILSGWLCSALLSWAGVGGTIKPSSRRPWLSDAVVVLITVVLFYPNLSAALAAAARDEGLSREWFAALTWLKASTPDPFGDPDTYYSRYDATAAAIAPAKYTVMTWWDYGYWVARVARRVPVANPTQSGAGPAAAFFTATNEAEARQLLHDLGASYVAADRELVFSPVAGSEPLRGKFEGLVVWAGKSSERFYESVYEPTPDGGYVPTWVFYPDYYRTMAVRLWQFGGRAAPQSSHATWVVTFATAAVGHGRSVRVIVNSTPFRDHSEAQRHLAALGPGPHRIVGRDPTLSPVPVPALTAFTLVHESSEATAGRTPRTVRIFATD